MLFIAKSLSAVVSQIFVHSKKSKAYSSVRLLSYLACIEVNPQSFGRLKDMEKQVIAAQ